MRSHLIMILAVPALLIHAPIGGTASAEESPFDDPNILSVPNTPAYDYPGVRSAPDEPRVVVGMIDTRVNPYHEFYYRHTSAVTDEVLAEFDVRPENVVELTRTGDFAADFAADQAFWERVERGVPYHFVGTNVITTSMGASDVDRLAPVASINAHGTTVSASVLRANPDAILFFVDIGNWDWPEAKGPGPRDLHELLMQHPGVDLFSTSYVIHDPVVGLIGVLPESRAMPETYEAVVERGKLHFAAAGNNPGAMPITGHAGPWWSIGVSGIEEDRPDIVTGERNGQGDQPLSGNVPDFVADFTPDPLPHCMECESGNGTVLLGMRFPNSGTSLSAPRAAGVASAVLLEIRRELDHSGGIIEVDGEPVMAHGDGGTVSNWLLRRALEQAAWVPRTTDYSPSGGSPIEMIAVPVNPVAPWLQVGWGELSSKPEKGVVSAALAHLGLSGTPREKDMGFCEHQTENIKLRRAYWENVAPLIPINWPGHDGVSKGAPDPFIYCTSVLPNHQ